MYAEVGVKGWQLFLYLIYREAIIFLLVRWTMRVNDYEGYLCKYPEGDKKQDIVCIILLFNLCNLWW